MKLRAIASLLLTTALAACASKTTPPVTPFQPPPPECTAASSQVVAYAALSSAFFGKCVRVRGLTVLGSRFFENGATYRIAQKTPDKQRWIILRWTMAKPAGLETYPQFVDVVGRVHLCDHCYTGFIIAVVESRIIPTAMD